MYFQSYLTQASKTYNKSSVQPLVHSPAILFRNKKLIHILILQKNAISVLCKKPKIYLVFHVLLLYYSLMSLGKNIKYDKILKKIWHQIKHESLIFEEWPASHTKREKNCLDSQRFQFCYELSKLFFYLSCVLLMK